MMKAFRRFIQASEQVNIGFGLWLGAALSVIFIRDALESLASLRSFPAINAFHFIHVPVFFISLLLSIIILLHFLTKEQIVKISRTGLIFFAVIIFPAAFDFLASVVIKKSVTYGYIDTNVKLAILNFFNPFFNIPDVPYSLRVEILFICIFSFIYIYIKTNKRSLALLGAVLVFTLCAAYGALPGLLVEGFIKVMAFFLRLFRPIFSNRVIEGIVNESLVVLIELFLTLLAAVMWFYFYDRKKFAVILKDLRLSRYITFFILLALGIGINLYNSGSADGFNIVRILGLCMVVFFALRFSAVVNDIFDIECDKISNPSRPLVTGLIGKDEYSMVGIVYLIFSLFFAFWVSEICFMITLIFISIYFLYSAPPFRLKRFFIISSLITGIQASLILLIGQVSLATSDKTVFLYPPLLWLVFLIFFLSSNIKDLKDIEGDRLCRIYSLPVIFGGLKARKIIGFLIFVSYLSVPLFLSRFFYDFKAAALSFCFGLVNYFYIKNGNSREGPVFLMFFMYVLIIFLFLL